MAVVSIPDQKKIFGTFEESRDFLATIGIDYEIWEPENPVGANATADEILAAYAKEIDVLKQQGGYVTADVIDINPDTPNLDTMLNKFNKEHAHDEDEVRFCIEGSGVFHIHPDNGPIVSIEVGAGDLIRVPKGTHHWFDLCSTKRIRRIRLFQEMVGWTPLYTETGAEVGYLPICMGPAFVAPVNESLKKLQESIVN